MEPAGLTVRLARIEDVPQIRASIATSLSNPTGKPQRKRLDESIIRSELLIMERVTNGESHILGFIEWHSRTGGQLTIRDIGTEGAEPQPTVMRRLFREMLSIVAAGSGEISLRAKSQVEPWDTVLADLPGFEVREREYSRGAWWDIWVWTGDPEFKPRNDPRRR